MATTQAGNTYVSQVVINDEILMDLIDIENSILQCATAAPMTYPPGQDTDGILVMREYMVPGVLYGTNLPGDSPDDYIQPRNEIVYRYRINLSQDPDRSDYINCTWAIGITDQMFGGATKESVYKKRFVAATQIAIRGAIEQKILRTLRDQVVNTVGPLYNALRGTAGISRDERAGRFYNLDRSLLHQIKEYFEMTGISLGGLPVWFCVSPLAFANFRDSEGGRLSPDGSINRSFLADNVKKAINHGTELAEVNGILIKKCTMIQPLGGLRNVNPIYGASITQTVNPRVQRFGSNINLDLACFGVGQQTNSSTVTDYTNWGVVGFIPCDPQSVDNCVGDISGTSIMNTPAVIAAMTQMAAVNNTVQKKTVYSYSNTNGGVVTNLYLDTYSDSKSKPPVTTPALLPDTFSGFLVVASMVAQANSMFSLSPGQILSLGILDTEDYAPTGSANAPANISVPSTATYNGTYPNTISFSRTHLASKTASTYAKVSYKLASLREMAFTIGRTGYLRSTTPPTDVMFLPVTGRHRFNYFLDEATIINDTPPFAYGTNSSIWPEDAFNISGKVITSSLQTYSTPVYTQSGGGVAHMGYGNEPFVARYLTGVSTGNAGWMVGMMEFGFIRENTFNPCPVSLRIMGKYEPGYVIVKGGLGVVSYQTRDQIGNYNKNESLYGGIIKGKNSGQAMLGSAINDNRRVGYHITAGVNQNLTAVVPLYVAN